MGAIEIRRRVQSALLLAATIPVITAGCTVGPNYVRPAVPTPAQYRFDQTAQAQSMADLPWYQIFEDPTLQALIREAIAQNLDLQIAVARVEEARARAGIAKSYLYPEVNGVATAGVRHAANSGGGSSAGADTTNQEIYGFQLSWELDLFGRLRRLHEAAVALLLASEQGRRGVLVTLVGDVASDYFQLRQLDLQLQIARETLRVNDETVTYFRNRLEGGVSNRLELDRIQANRAVTAAAIPDIEKQIAIVEDALSLLLGRAPAAVAREPLHDEALPPAIPPGLPASLIERRPDVVEAEQLLVAANANIGAAKALYFPNVTLTGFAGGVSGDLTQFIGGGGAVFSAGADLLQPVFQAGRLRRNVEVAQAQFDAALAGYRKAALNGYREVANALITIQKLAEMRSEQQAGVVALQDASDLARARYESGLASYLEILTADQDLFQQQILLADTRGAELRARAELYRSLGGGWQP